jgi:hypothetical protein
MMPDIKTGILFMVLAADLVLIIALSLTAVAFVRVKKWTHAKYEIFKILKGKNADMLSFEDLLNEKPMKKYDEPFLKDVIDYFPTEFHKAILKDEQGRDIVGLADVSREAPFLQRTPQKVARDGPTKPASEEPIADLVARHGDADPMEDRKTKG